MTGNYQQDKSDGMEESTSLWVFGYGSLVWKPGFKHGKTLIGSVRGFARRYRQIFHQNISQVLTLEAQDVAGQRDPQGNFRKAWQGRHSG